MDENQIEAFPREAQAIAEAASAKARLDAAAQLDKDAARCDELAASDKQTAKARTYFARLAATYTDAARIIRLAIPAARG